MMSIMLQDIGYKLVRTFDGDYQSETWEKEFSGGYDKHHLVFDTIHGGAWTVECYWQHFERNDDPNVFVPMGFNPNRDDTAGKGTWYMRDIPALDVRECAAIAEHITALEYERRKKKGGCAEGGTVSETYIDGAKFAELVKGHFRKLAGLRGDVE